MNTELTATAILTAATYPAIKTFTTSVANDLADRFHAKIGSGTVRRQLDFLEKVRGRAVLNDEGRLEVNPKYLFQILDEVAYEYDEEMQDLWAGLLLSAKDQDVLHHIDTLRNLTKPQALLMQKICEDAKCNSKIQARPSGIIVCYNYKPSYSCAELMKVMRLEDINAVDQALDDLRRRGLIDGGFGIADMSDLSNIKAHFESWLVVAPLLCEGER